jgi:hypothetical protein
MSLYQQLSNKYADVWEKNRNGRILVVKILTELKEMMAEYFECSSGYIYFSPRNDIARKMYTADQALTFHCETDIPLWKIGLGISLFMGKNRRLPKAELIIPIEIYKENQVILVLPHSKHVIDSDDKNTFLPIFAEIYRLIDEWLSMVTKENIQKVSAHQIIGIIQEKPDLNDD